MTNKLLFLTPLLFAQAVFSHPLSESDSKTMPLTYLKVGTELGVGYRSHKNAHGYDLSINHAAFFGETWTGGKALYLFYPFSRSQNYFYFGAGVGLVYGTLDSKSSSLLSPGAGEIHTSRLYPTFETAVGYEFLTGRKVKLFTQFELTMPLQSKPFPLFVEGPGEGWKPTVTVGIGF